MKRLKIAAILLSAALAVGLGVAAQTPDGETPANDGVCDDLMYATPGLYGLCVAFCEAQDCEESDPAAAAANCRPSSSKLLEIFNRKRASGDPEMPCLSEPCPCFDDEDILAVQATDPNGLFNACYEGNSPDGYTSLATWNPYGPDTLGAFIWANDTHCAYVAALAPGEPLIDRYLEVTADQADECRALIQPYLVSSCEWIADAP